MFIQWLTDVTMDVVWFDFHIKATRRFFTHYMREGKISTCDTAPSPHHHQHTYTHAHTTTTTTTNNNDNNNNNNTHTHTHTHTHRQKTFHSNLYAHMLACSRPACLSISTPPTQNTVSRLFSSSWRMCWNGFCDVRYPFGGCYYLSPFPFR